MRTAMTSLESRLAVTRVTRRPGAQPVATAPLRSRGVENLSPGRLFKLIAMAALPRPNAALARPRLNSPKDY